MKTIFVLKTELLSSDWEVVEQKNYQETHIQCFLSGDYIVAEMVCVSGNSMFGCGIVTKISSKGFEHLFDSSKWFNIEIFNNN